jgi:putative transposase
MGDSGYSPYTYMMRDHIHMCIGIAPKYLVSHIVGYIKGKSAIAIA